MPETTTRDGVTLHYLDEGTGPVIVFVAGFGGRASSWQLQCDALRAAGHRVITIDRRHHGDSGFPEHGQRIARHGADLQHVQDELGLTNAVWVGSSMGASALLARADLYGTVGVRGLVLVDQTPKMLNAGDWDLGMYGLTLASLEAFVAEFPAGLSPFHVPPPAHVLEVLAADPGEPFRFDRLRPLLLDHAVQDWRDVVPRLAVPVLALGGRHSPLWPVASTEWIGQHAPHGTTVILEGSGHAPHLAEPELFTRTLLDWVAGLS